MCISQDSPGNYRCMCFSFREGGQEKEKQRETFWRIGSCVMGAAWQAGTSDKS